MEADSFVSVAGMSSIGVSVPQAVHLNISFVVIVFSLLNLAKVVLVASHSQTTRRCDLYFVFADLPPLQRHAL
jgi:hypothetical protein